MIKETELRINSIYLSTKFKVPVKLELSDLVELYHRCDGAALDEEIIAELFEPISITEEWLLKAGFEKMVYNKTIREYTIEFPPNRAFIAVRFGEMKDEYYKTENQMDSIRIRPELSGSMYQINGILYIHQLQNLIFVLTGKELEFNI